MQYEHKTKWTVSWYKFLSSNSIRDRLVKRSEFSTAQDAINAQRDKNAPTNWSVLSVEYLDGEEIEEATASRWLLLDKNGDNDTIPSYIDDEYTTAWHNNPEQA